MNYKRLARPALAIAAVAAFAACSKTTTGAAIPAPAPTPAPAAAHAPTPAAQAPAAAAPSASGLPAGVTMAMVASGDSIFHDRSCRTCHGMDLKGAENGPDLTSGHWMHGDGSFQSIVHVITTGIPVAQLKNPDHTKAMPARGGSRPALLTDEQVRDVAAYVYSVSHKM